MIISFYVLIVHTLVTPIKMRRLRLSQVIAEHTDFSGIIDIKKEDEDLYINRVKH